MLRREQVLVTKVTPVKAKAEAGRRRASWEGRLGQEPCDLHAAVLGHDRRRPAAGAVPRDPRRQEEDQTSRRRSPDAGDVENGQTLADAMRKHPKTFDPLFTNMIAAGEAGGILDTILKRLATYIEKNVKLKGQVKSAMVYPVAVIVIAGVVVGGHPVEVIPTFGAMFASLGAEAAVAHADRHRAQQRLVRYGWLGMMPAAPPDGRSRATTPRRRAGASSTARAEAARSGHHHAEDRRGAVLPHAVDAHQLGRADSRRLEITARTSGNAVVEDAIMRRARASRAATPSPPAQGDHVFPPMVVQMIGVGEATGALDTMLSKIADFYEEEVDTAVAGMLTLMEPVMIAFLA
jgi:type IV pilus assembly protein PilC